MAEAMILSVSAAHPRVCLEEAVTQQGFEAQAFVDGLKFTLSF